MPDLHIDVVAVIFGFIAFTVWLVRIEFKTLQNEKDIEENKKEAEVAIKNVEKKHDDLAINLWKEVSEMNKSLARIEGRLSREDK